MKKHRVFLVSLMLTIILGLFSNVPSLLSPAYGQTDTVPYRLVGYYPSYSIYQDYFVTDIAADRLTHLNYAWVSISVTGQCESSDLWTDTQFSYPDDTPDLRLRGNIRQLQLLRGEHPDLKILFTIGGWEYSERLPDVAATPESRERFARSCVSFMRDYLFDGIDMDWRYPVSGGKVEGRPADRENYTLLLAEMREQLDAASSRDDRPYLLTMLAPATESQYAHIELDQVHRYVDWINLMSFGFNGEWSSVASHHAPLYGNTRDPRGPVVQNDYNVHGAVSNFLDAGVPARKIVVGIPFYAQTWRNVRPGNYLGLYERADGVPGGTRPGGILYYRDMLPLINGTDFVEFFDEEARVPWLYSPDERIAISYEDPRSIREKTDYVREHELGGVMAWQVNFDDAANSLLNAVYGALMR